MYLIMKIIINVVHNIGDICGMPNMPKSRNKHSIIPLMPNNLFYLFSNV